MQVSIVNQFRIDHPRFIKDYKKRIEFAEKKGAWINCFGSVFLDELKNLYICYFNSELNLPEIYRYNLDGKFLDTLRIKNINNRSNSIVNAKDKHGNYYGKDSTSSKIIIYREDR